MKLGREVHVRRCLPIVVAVIRRDLYLRVITIGMIDDGFFDLGLLPLFLRGGGGFPIVGVKGEWGEIGRHRSIIVARRGGGGCTGLAHYFVGQK